MNLDPLQKLMNLTIGHRTFFLKKCQQNLLITWGDILKTQPPQHGL